MTASLQPTSHAAPATRDWTEVTTVGDLLVRAARLWPDQDAVVVDAERRTFAELLESAERSAVSLAGLGVGRGERVAILMPTCMDFVDMLFGCALIGASAVTIHARSQPHELRYKLEHSRSIAVVATDSVREQVDYLPRLVEALEGSTNALRARVVLGEERDGFMSRAEFESLGDSAGVSRIHERRAAIGLGDEVMMKYTSGTTADPKGCMLNHESLVRTSIGAARRWGLVAGDRFWDPLPMYNMAAIFPLLGCLHVGATFVATTHFDATQSLVTMERERVTAAYPVWPTITQELLNHPRFAEFDLGAIRMVTDTGTGDSMRRTQELWPSAAVIGVYGMTETGGAVCVGDPADPVELRTERMGRPLPGVEVRIADPVTGEEVPTGEVGEITVRGPGAFVGYFDAGDANERAFRDGWFRTGDLGLMDERGYISFAGREKDVLKVGGENVSAAEIEAFVQLHPAVKLAQVVGVPDQRYGEVPGLFVEFLPGCTASEIELIEFCQGRIAAFKVPRRVRFVNEWPMSATKIQKFKLREEMAHAVEQTT